MKTPEKRILGIRAESASVHWAVVSGNRKNPILDASDTEEAPKAYGEGETLAWIRQKVADIIDTYKPSQVAVRYAEGIARGNTKGAKSRCRVEGVVLEVSSSKNLPIVTGPLNTFGKHLGSPPKEFLTHSDFRGLDWSKYKDTCLREAILVAAAILPSMD